MMRGRCEPIRPAGMLAAALLTLVVAAIAAPASAGDAAANAKAAGLADRFVFLRDVDPTILQDMRYAGRHNFVGERIDGYEAAECILTEPAARALKRVQDELRGRGLSLKVYDCYRPARAVAHFVRWAEKAGDQGMKAEFYPKVDKGKVFALGYIARRSGHSRGSSVDLTIVKLPPAFQPDYLPGEPLTACTAPVGERYPDNGLDYGTGYDCFDDKSHTGSTAVGAEARANRKFLVEAMRRAGFSNYAKEWWHYDFGKPPYPKTYFDFPVTAHPEAIPGAQ
ncbi:MAG TPA: M15 family metallopeptidase [Hyphomicrobiales bacterium]|nr:M15 family metallopeptidase [Kaistiaceae bacterium]HQF30293.1 M15 family metallopeptidase [Hyphomicrobiales bacterium]